MKGFTNESTYEKMLSAGKEQEFDMLFEKAAAEAKSNFGKEYSLCIGGRQITTAEKLVETSPIDANIILGTFQKATAEHARLAISEADSTFNEWRNTDYRERIEIFNKAAKILSSKKFEIAAILSYENGKTRYESIGEVDEGIDLMRYYAQQMGSNKGFVRRNTLEKMKGPGKAGGFQGEVLAMEKIKISFKPYGVFGVIAPFNFPISISIGMSTGALITGNTVVFKPSSSDNMAMLSGFKVYEIFKDAGIPDGVFNYITGLGAIMGDEMLKSESVKGIAFTGSRQAAMNLLTKSSLYGRPKQFILEMGGKNPTIVTKSADLESAAIGIASAAFGYSGQKCSALSRLYVHESIKESLVGKIIERARNMKTGNPINKEVFIGPLISESAFKRYKDSIAKAKANGRVLYGGNEFNAGLKGFYVEPAIIEIKHDSELVKNELFLPLLTVESFKEIKEAIRLANDTNYGLTAGFYGKKKSEIEEFQNGIEAGVIYINREASATTGAMVGAHTFVGWKNSGYTGKGSGSNNYLQQFMHEQSLSIAK